MLLFIWHCTVDNFTLTIFTASHVCYVFFDWSNLFTWKVAKQTNRMVVIVIVTLVDIYTHCNVIAVFWTVHYQLRVGWLVVVEFMTHIDLDVTLVLQERSVMLRPIIAVGCCTQTACHACNGGMQQQHRLSGQSCESGVSSSSRQSYHSGTSTGSSSSQGSLDRLEESGYSSTVNVHDLMRQGRSVRFHISLLIKLHWWCTFYQPCAIFLSQAVGVYSLAPWGFQISHWEILMLAKWNNSGKCNVLA